MPSPSDLSCRCPGCGCELWARRKGQWTLQNRILKLDDSGQIVARCPECANDVPVPFLALTESAPAKPATAPGVRTRMILRVDRPQGT